MRTSCYGYDNWKLVKSAKLFHETDSGYGRSSRGSSISSKFSKETKGRNYIYPPPTNQTHLLKPGEAIMAGLTGFGAANIGQQQHMEQLHQQQLHSQQQQHQQPHQGWSHHDKMPHVKVIEQPAENKLRFR